MNLDDAIKDADKRIQALIDDRFDRLIIRNKFTFEYARRSMYQRLRNDKREQRKWK